MPTASVALYMMLAQPSLVAAMNSVNIATPALSKFES